MLINTPYSYMGARLIFGERLQATKHGKHF